MNKSPKFSPEVRERAVRTVQERRADFPSLCGPPLSRIAPKIQVARCTGKRMGRAMGLQGGCKGYWCNHVRMLMPIGRIPPAEAEANDWRQLAASDASTDVSN